MRELDFVNGEVQDANTHTHVQCPHCGDVIPITQLEEATEDPQ